jgi:hypothetical protein
MKGRKEFLITEDENRGGARVQRNSRRYAHIVKQFMKFPYCRGWGGVEMNDDHKR